MVMLGVADRNENAKYSHSEKIELPRLSVKLPDQLPKAHELGKVSTRPPAIRKIDPGNVGGVVSQVVEGARFERHMFETAAVSSEELMEAAFYA
jgi:hypothetical protein